MPATLNGTAAVPQVAVPAAVREWLERQAFGPDAIACLELGPGPRRRWHGDARRLGVPDEAWLEALLVGLPEDADVHLPLLQTPLGSALQLHQLSRPPRRYLLLQAVDQIFEALGEEQQQAHDLALRHRQQGQLVQALQQAATVLQQSEQELRRITRAQDLFIRQISHELGTPLAALLAHLELLQASQLEPSARTGVQAIRRGVQHLNTLLQGALDRDRLARGRLQPRPVRTQLAELVEEVAALFAPQLAARGQALQLQVPALEIVVDALRLRQVLINLVSNAVKYGGSGSIAISVAVLRRPGRKQRLRITVADQGPGLSAAQRQRIFESGARYQPEQPGSGLGLGIVRQLAQVLGGRLGVDSAPGAGSRFWIELPLVAAASVAPVLPAALLLVDDDPELRELLVLVLERRGHLVTAVAQDAVAAWQAGRPAAATVLVDLGLAAGRSGLDEIRDLRTGGFAGRIVATSADDDAELAAAARSAGADGFIAKPFEFEQLFEVLDGNAS